MKYRNLTKRTSQYHRRMFATFSTFAKKTKSAPRDKNPWTTKNFQYSATLCSSCLCSFVILIYSVGSSARHSCIAVGTHKCAGKPSRRSAVQHPEIKSGPSMSQVRAKGSSSKTHPSSTQHLDQFLMGWTSPDPAKLVIFKLSNWPIQA